MQVIWSSESTCEGPSLSISINHFFWVDVRVLHQFAELLEDPTTSMNQCERHRLYMVVWKMVNSWIQQQCFGDRRGPRVLPCLASFWSEIDRPDRHCHCRFWIACLLLLHNSIEICVHWHIRCFRCESGVFAVCFRPRPQTPFSGCFWRWSRVASMNFGSDAWIQIQWICWISFFL